MTDWYTAVNYTFNCNVPPKTEYSLTEEGKDMKTLITTIRNYGLAMMGKQGLK